MPRSIRDGQLHFARYFHHDMWALRQEFQNPLRSCWKNSQPLCPGKFALAFVKGIKDVRLQNDCCGNVQKIKRSGAKLRAVTARKNQRFFPHLRAKRRYAIYTGSLMLQKQIKDRPSFAARPFLSEYSQVDSVGEFRLAQRREEKDGFGLNQSRGNS